MNLGTVNDRVLAAGEGRSGKLLKMYGPLAAILLAFVPIIGNHIDSLDRRREAREAFERQQRLERRVESNSVVTAQTAVKVESNATEITRQTAAVKYLGGVTAQTAVKVESNATEITRQTAAVKYLGGVDVVENAAKTEWANAPASMTKESK